MTLRTLLPLVLIIIISAWLSRFRNRRLLESGVILKELYPGETDSIERFAPNEGFDFFADDKEFWNASKGWKGLRRKRHNAICFVQFCQSLNPDKRLEREELRIITMNSILISFYTGCSLLEYPFRWFIKDMPHSCARNATNLYWEMERRVTTLCSVYRPELLDQLYQIL